MTWTVKEKIGLPVLEERTVYTDMTAMVPSGESITKLPGEKITKAEMNSAGQTDEDIAALVNDGAIEED